MNIIKPSKLNKGDTIGIVAPAYPFPADKNSQYYQQYTFGRSVLENMGFELKEGMNLKKIEWWRAGSPQERAEDINKMFADKEVKAIIAHDGGNDCIPVLEYIDYELVKNNPKPFIGFSNITNIHSALFSRTGLVGFHMGLLTYELGWIWNKPSTIGKDISKKYFHEVLSNNQPLSHIDHITAWECWRKGSASGMLFGGNLSMLDSLIGTDYFPTIEDLTGSILFWELDNSPSYRIERILTHLKYTGVLNVISGMIIGKLVDIKPTAQEGFEEPSHRELVTKILKDYNFPILANVDFGHKIAQIPMPIGIHARIDAENLILEFTESAVR